MISLRVFLFVTLTVWGLRYVRARNSWTSPFSFVYMNGDKLDIDINLLNVPPMVNFYVLYYQNVPVKSGMTVRTINITQKLDQKSLRFHIELRIRNKVCSTKIILDGLSDEHADKVEQTFRALCLNKSLKPCKIYVDFGNKCEDKIDDCTQSNGRLTCESLDEVLPQDSVHQWYQTYRDGSFIGTIPPVKGSKSKFIISFLKFDDSSYIYKEMIPTHRKKEWLLDGFKMPANEYKKYEISRKETYSESELFNFTCQNIAHTQIGWIDPTGYKITTYNETSFSRRFTKMDNNSMLCCLHYNTYEIVVERSVDGITQLIYKKPVKQDNVKDGTQRERNNSLETQVILSTSLPTKPQKPKKTNITNIREPEAPQSSMPTERPQDQQHIDSPQTSPHKTEYYIGIASVAGIIILISLIYVVIKKCCRKSSDPEQTLELETYASTNMMLYAELDIRPGNAPPPASTEDPTYAEIIGVLRPQSEHAKK